MNCAKPFRQKELLGVPLWSLALLSVVVGELLNHSGDLTRHHKYCSGQPPPPKITEFHCVYGRMFHHTHAHMHTHISRLVTIAH